MSSTSDPGVLDAIKLAFAETNDAMIAVSHDTVCAHNSFAAIKFNCFFLMSFVDIHRAKCTLVFLAMLRRQYCRMQLLSKVKLSRAWLIVLILQNIWFVVRNECLHLQRMCSTPSARTSRCTKVALQETKVTPWTRVRWVEILVGMSLSLVTVSVVNTHGLTDFDRPYFSILLCSACIAVQRDALWFMTSLPRMLLLTDRGPARVQGLGRCWYRRLPYRRCCSLQPRGSRTRQRPNHARCSQLRRIRIQSLPYAQVWLKQDFNHALAA